jgi:proteasome lid subunit RPN8/RPN11
MDKNKKSNPSLSMAPRVEPETRRRAVVPAKPVLRFTPTAWAKLLCMRDAGPVEVGGFAITSPDDLLRVEEFVTVKQLVTVASVAFDDAAVADFFDCQIDQGRKPQQFLRIWLHSHPGDSASPSSTDEETFARVFGNSDWAVMFILARGGQTYARLRFNVGPGGHVQIPVEVDFHRTFAASDQPAWKEEYKANVHPEPIMPGMFGLGQLDEFDRELLHAEQLDLADQDLPWESF